MAKLKLHERIGSSPLGIFILCIVVFGLAIMVFRFFLPPAPPPLPTFFISWRINQGLLDFLNLFPALALSALAVPFGFIIFDAEGLPAFSSHFLDLIKKSIITAITAAALYGLISFLLLPLVREQEDFMRSRGRLFYLAKARAEEHAAAKDWPQTAQFVNICERIWPNSPEMESLRIESSVGMEAFRGGRQELSEAGRQSLAADVSPVYSGIPGQRTPVTAGEALSLADTARQEQRLYDAHWLASVAGRLARPNSIEAATATHLAAEIWDQLAAISPNAGEVQAWNLYRLKREGYEAMISGDWIRAYYLFRDHASLSPHDPDVENFLLLCERGITGVAFFIDEIELSVGELLIGAMFSLPAETEPLRSGGRAALRISSLSTFPDYSYGIGVELIAFDREDRFLYRLEAPYVKIVPMTLDQGPRLVLLMRALDRVDRDKYWEPFWTGPAADTAYLTDEAQILLNLSYEDFLILSRVSRGPENLDTADLFAAEKRLGAYGYVPQVFQGEIVYRFCEPILFLPLTILTILYGWRFRAKFRPRFSGVLTLAILPMVFYGLMHLYRSCLNNMAIWSVVSFGYSASLALFISGTVVCFIASLILLSAQHG